jgi:hypothetical protein
MEKINLEQMSKAQKVELLEKISTGDITVVDGYALSKNEGMILIEKDGKYYFDMEFANECKKEHLKHVETVIILPDNGRELIKQSSDAN